MNIKVTGKRLGGKVSLIGSKSDIHRLLICAALSRGETKIKGVTLSKDIKATADCLRAFAAELVHSGDTLTVKPYINMKKNATLDCNESGSTLRFLLPIIAALGIGARFEGRGRLPERPLSPLYELLTTNGVKMGEQLPLTMEGKLAGNVFEIDGSVSSQFVSGLLLAAPLLGGATVRVVGKAESVPYIGMTVDALRRFGVTVSENEPFCYTVTGGYDSPGEITAEGDWSNAAFWLTAAVLSDSHGFEVSNIKKDSLQGDKAILEILKKSGASFSQSDNAVAYISREKLIPFELDASQIPDLVPIAALLACGAEGKSRIYNAARLRIKESDRLSSVCNMINALGGEAAETDDGIIVNGRGILVGGRVNASNDHRIVMTAAVAALLCENAVEIEGAEAVDKSYPDFFAELTAKGMIVCPPASEQS